MPTLSEDVENEDIELDTAAKIDRICQAFHSHGAPGATATTSYMFCLSGEGGGDLRLTLSPEGAVWERDASGDTDLVVRMSADDFVAMADGKIDGRFAVASERIEIEGERETALAMLAQVTIPEEESE